MVRSLCPYNFISLIVAGFSLYSLTFGENDEKPQYSQNSIILATVATMSSLYSPLIHILAISSS